LVAVAELLIGHATWLRRKGFVDESWTSQAFPRSTSAWPGAAVMHGNGGGVRRDGRPRRVGGAVTSVVITRRRHPLEGQALRVLGRMHRHSRLALSLVLPDGGKSLVLAAWTNLEPDRRWGDRPVTVTLGVANCRPKCVIIFCFVII
jgi:hypothetical protein